MAGISQTQVPHWAALMSTNRLFSWKSAKLACRPSRVCTDHDKYESTEAGNAGGQRRGSPAAGASCLATAIKGS